MGVKIIYPVYETARISQYYGENPQNYPKTSGHNGIDWAITEGTGVWSAHAGQVIKAEEDKSGYGLHVRVLHSEGWGTIYGHMRSLAVKEGDMVSPGALLGESGNTGNSTGPHLHFELRLNMLNVLSGVDPMPFLKSGQNVVASGKVLVQGLRVREKPEATAGIAVRKYLNIGDPLDFVEIVGDWGKLLAAQESWVAIKYAGETYVQLTTTPPELSEAEILKRLWAAHPELH